VAALASGGITALFPIQAATLPDALAGFLRRAAQPIRATVRVTGSPLEGDSRWLKAP